MAQKADCRTDSRLLSRHLNGCQKILLLKIGQSANICLGKRDTVSTNHPFILIVIVTMNDGDHTTRKRRERCVYAEDVSILLFTVTAEDTLNIAVVDGIYERWMVGMCAA